MNISMYEACVPPFSRMLGNLAAVLEKGAEHAEARKIDPAVLVAGRLSPDMFPLAKQVQVASDTAKGGASRLAQVEPPKYEDDETTLAELAARLRRTAEYLGTLRPEQFLGAEDRMVTWNTRAGSRSMQGLAYLLNHVTPNFYFHVTTAYDILRRDGVPIGKQDFLGRR